MRSVSIDLCFCGWLFLFLDLLLDGISDFCGIQFSWAGGVWGRKGREGKTVGARGGSHGRCVALGGIGDMDGWESMGEM